MFVCGGVVANIYHGFFPGLPKKTQPPANNSHYVLHRKFHAYCYMRLSAAAAILHHVITDVAKKNRHRCNSYEIRPTVGPIQISMIWFGHEWFFVS